MAEREIYHLDIVIGVKGDDDTKKKLSAMDKYLASMEKRARILNKINASPAVRINDKITKQMEKINGGLEKLNKAAVNPMVEINDKATKQLEKINGTMGRLNKMKVAVTTSIIDKISEPVNKIKGGLDRLNSAGVFVKTNIIDRVSGPTKTILSGLGKIKGTAWSATVTVKDKVSSGLGIIRSCITKTIAAATSLQGILLGVGGAWAGIVRPMQISGDFEQTQMAFTTMLKSAQKANSFLAQAQDMANNTPFEFPELANTSKKLLAFGWNVKKVLPDLTTIGNAAAGLGLGSEGINQISIALGQIKAKGRVQGDEILQLTEAGIPATKILQEQLGLTAKQVANIGDAGIDADKAINALLTGMDKRFHGMMENQSKTALGLMSTLKDTFDNKLINRWGQGLWTGIKPGLMKVTNWLDKSDRKVGQLGDLFEEAGKTVSSSIGGALEDSQKRLNRLMDSSQWKNADLGGKITLAWDKIVAEPFSAWWNGPGKPKINKVAADMGSAIGGTLGSGITSLLNALGGKEDKVGASGTSAGTAFTNAFLEAFDTGKIVDKLFSAFKNANINAAKDHDVSSIAKAGIMDYIVFSVLGGKTLLKGGGKLFNWLRTGSTAGKAASAAGAGAKAAKNVSGIGKIANALKKIGSITNSKVFKALPVLGPLATVATSAYAVSSSSNKARAASGEFGGIASGLAAAKLGGMAGSIFGPVGTGVGALIAGIAGTWAGHKGATTLYDKYNANSSANKVPNGFSKSFNDLTQTNMKNLNTTKALDRSQTGITAQSNAYRGTLSNLLSSTGLTVDSQGNLRAANGQYEGSLNDLLTSTGLVMDSQGNLLDANSLVQDSQVNLALSMDNLSQTVSNLDGNMGGIGTQQSEGIWGKVKNFLGFGDKTQSSSSTIIKNQQNSNSGGYNFLSPFTKKANGGITRGPEFSLIGEAGTEAVIPLSNARRNRGLSLWQQAGKMLGVRMFANGGIVGGSTGGAKVAKATANVSTSIAMGDNALSQFKQYGNKINTNLSTGIDQTRQIPNNSINKVTTVSKGILNRFSQTGHIYGIAVNNDIASGIRSNMGNVTNVVKILTDKVITEFKNGFEIHSPSAVMTRLAKFIPAGVIKGMTSVDIKAFIKNWIGDIGSMAGGMSGNVSGWLTAALGVTGTPMNWLSGLLRLTQAESGGNPMAVNPQAVNGEHATGLLQTLGSTFRQYAVKGLDNILNPIANAAAAINYIKSTYGSVYNTPLFKGGSYVGYATGTDNAKPGLARINEKGWEFVDFTGGEKVLNHNKSVSLMDRATSSLNRVKSAVSNLGMGDTESRDVPESSSNPMYYTSQPQMAVSGGYGDVNVDVQNNFNDSTDVDEIVERATVQFARQLKAALLNKKK